MNKTNLPGDLVQQSWENIVENSVRNLLTRKFKQAKILDINPKKASFEEIAKHGAFPYLIVVSSIPFKLSLNQKMLAKNNEGFHKIIRKAKALADHYDWNTFAVVYYAKYSNGQTRKLYAMTNHLMYHYDYGFWFKIWEETYFVTELESLINASLGI